MDIDDYSFAHLRVPSTAFRDNENACDYTPYASGTGCVPFRINLFARVLVAVLSLIVFVFSILGMTLDLAGFDIVLDYGFVATTIPLERYKAFTFREVFGGGAGGGGTAYTGKDKTAMSVAQAFLILAVVFSFFALVFAVTLIILRGVYERQRRHADEARESERQRYKTWLAAKAQRRDELARQGFPTTDVDAERYSHQISPAQYAADENHRRQVDQRIGVTLFAMLIVTIFALFMTLVLFAGLFFFRYVSISGTANVSSVYLDGFWLILAALLLAVVAMVLVEMYTLCGVCVCAKCGGCCDDPSKAVRADGDDVDEPIRASTRAVAAGQAGSGGQGSTNQGSPQFVDDRLLPAAGAQPAKTVHYPPRNGSRVSGVSGNSEMQNYDPVRKKIHSDERDFTSTETIRPDTVMVAQGLPVALPGPPVPTGYSAEDLQRQLQSGSQPSSSSGQPHSNSTGYENLGLPAPQYQIPHSYQPTTVRQPMPRGGDEL